MKIALGAVGRGLKTLLCGRDRALAWFIRKQASSSARELPARLRAFRVLCFCVPVITRIARERVKSLRVMQSSLSAGLSWLLRECVEVVG